MLFSFRDTLSEQRKIDCWEWMKDFLILQHDRVSDIFNSSLECYLCLSSLLSSLLSFHLVLPIGTQFCLSWGRHQLYEKVSYFFCHIPSLGKQNFFFFTFFIVKKLNLDGWQSHLSTHLTCVIPYSDKYWIDKNCLITIIHKTENYSIPPFHSPWTIRTIHLIFSFALSSSVETIE